VITVLISVDIRVVSMPDRGAAAQRFPATGNTHRHPPREYQQGVSMPDRGAATQRFPATGNITTRISTLINTVITKYQQVVCAC
jgi:hypothetical protein